MPVSHTLFFDDVKVVSDYLEYTTQISTKDAFLSFPISIRLDTVKERLNQAVFKLAIPTEKVHKVPHHLETMSHQNEQSY